MENVGYLYRHIRLDKNEVFYVGIGADKNWKRAYSERSRNPHWRNVVNKTKYDVEILFDNMQLDKLKLKEIELIKLYGRRDLGMGSLVNMTDGGDGILGLKKPHTGRKGKSLDEIYKNSELANIVIENRMKPFIIKITTSCGLIEEIECRQQIDFYKLLGFSYPTLRKLKKSKTFIIPKGKNFTNNYNYPIGTVLELSYIDKPKITYKRLKIDNKYSKPFIITVYEPNKKSYEVNCKNIKDFKTLLKIPVKILMYLKKHGEKEIIQKRSGAKHNLPVGTILKFKYL